MDKVTGIAKRSTSQLISLLQTQTGVNIGKCCSNSAYDHRDRLPRVWSVQKWKWRRDNKDCTLLCLPSFAKPLSTVESSAWKKKISPAVNFVRHFPAIFHSTPKCIINPSLTDRRLKMRDQIPDQWYYWRVWWNVNREISNVTRVTSIIIGIITFIWETYELRIINSTSNEFNLISLPGIIRPCIDINDDNK